MPKWWIEQLVPRNHYDNLFTYLLVLGGVGLVVSAFFVWRLRSTLFRFIWGVMFLFTLFCTVTLTYAYLVEPNRLIVKTYSVSTDRLEKGQTLKVAVIADFQYKSVVSPSYVEHVVNVVNSTQPDFIFLVGDLIESGSEELPLYTPLKNLKATTGKFAVLGNHDYAYPSGNEDHEGVAAEVETVLEAADFRVLRNEITLANFKGRNIVIGGIDDTWVGAADTQKVVDLMRSQNFGGLKFILHHEPDAILPYQSLQDTYTFAGHCHGSQVTLGKTLNPFFNLPLFPPYCTILKGESKGWTDNQNLPTFVTPGVGTGNVRLRLFSLPEVSVIEFRGK